MRLRFLLLTLFLAACNSQPREVPAPSPEVRAEMDSIEAGLRQNGLPVERVEPLASLREFPACSDARFRFRVRFEGAPNRFVNVSRFATPVEAAKCRDVFKEIALRAGPTGWERLGPTIHVAGPWLYLFPQDLNDVAFRRRVVQSLPAQ